MSAQIAIESSSGFRLEQMTSVDVVRSMTQPAECAFSVGDRATWEALQRDLAIGSQWSVYVGGRLRFRGRLMNRGAAGPAASGLQMQCSVTSAMYDLGFNSMPTLRQLKRATLGDVVKQAYEQFGIQVEFRADSARNFLTGRGGSGGSAADVESASVEDAKPQPGTPPLQYVSQHLARFGLIQWDGPNGDIVIGSPNESPEAQFALNDSIAIDAGIQASQDFRDAASKITIAGQTRWRSRRVSTIATTSERVGRVEFEVEDTVLSGVGLNRSVVLEDEQVRTIAQATRVARRELSARSMATDTLTAVVHGVEQNGSVWTENAVVDVDSRVARGLYLVTQVTHHEDAATGPTTALQMLRQGVWTT